MKKNLLLVLMVSMVIVFTGCRPKEVLEEVVDTSDNYKVGIITGTVSQGEEDFQAAQNMLKQYGADRIVTATYPDKFAEETETTIARVVQLASDPDVKAIVFVQAVPGAMAAISKVRETRPDLLFIAGVAAEPPREIAALADVVFLNDELGVGSSLIQQAKKQGATTFVHYSFPRHLSYDTISARQQLFMENAAAEGLEYVEATAPDPTGDAGVSGAQQFILEDVPRKIAEYGPDTAFFATNCSMMEPLILSVLREKAIFPLQCCPSPYHAYPTAFNISTVGNEGDTEYMLDQITQKVDDGGNAGRMSTWPIPVNMLMIEAATDYAMRYAAGEFTDRHDDDEVKKSVQSVVAKSGNEAFLRNYTDAQGTLDNFYMIFCSYYDF